MMGTVHTVLYCSLNSQSQAQQGFEGSITTVIYTLSPLLNTYWCVCYRGLP